ncbi:uncharacterized protein [Rutidosis leptorrhynchoides]|uniref:uncharacterized protein n=1 Tax=Rutidosis leptorrhynchoides TaxID=125765 RepID=UPI003A99B256
MGHNCCSKQKVKRGLWSPEEDEKLIRHINTHGFGSWSSIPKQAGLERCGKSCRLRWINYLRPDLKRGSFTAQEECIIIDVHRVLGNKWAQIAKHLPGRTDNEVKNFWHSYIKKKLIAQGLDPNTHNFVSPPPQTNFSNNDIIACTFPQLGQRYHSSPPNVFNPFSNISYFKDSSLEDIKPSLISLPSSFPVGEPIKGHSDLSKESSIDMYQKIELVQNPNLMLTNIQEKTPHASVSSCPILNLSRFGVIDDNYCTWENSFLDTINSQRDELQAQVMVKSELAITDFEKIDHEGKMMMRDIGSTCSPYQNNYCDRNLDGFLTSLERSNDVEKHGVVDQTPLMNCGMYYNMNPLDRLTWDC